MSKILFLVSLSVILCLLLIGCKTASNKSVVPTVTYPVPVTVTKTVTPNTPTTTPPIVISTNTPLPPLSANIITINNCYNEGNNLSAVFFFNNSDNYIIAKCDVRQHDANGNYLTDAIVTSGYIPPQAHLVSIVPAIGGTLLTNTVGKLTVNDLQAAPNPLPPATQPSFIHLTVSNIHIESDKLPTENPDLPPTTILVGTLSSESLPGTQSVKPSSIIIQILKSTADGNLTLVGNSPFSSIKDAILGRGEIPMPPSGESISFYIPLWDNITIINTDKAIIDGEITVVAQK